ncbi:hypothetical protein GCM10007358_10970 [Phocicoccus schoeneichii]|nr:hypothetical protein GCM10007358_10970 [Jeotgalicoccus schoeneichii]
MFHVKLSTTSFSNSDFSNVPVAIRKSLMNARFGALLQFKSPVTLN